VRRQSGGEPAVFVQRARAVAARGRQRAAQVLQTHRHRDTGTLTKKDPFNLKSNNIAKQKARAQLQRQAGTSKGSTRARARQEIR
jgi:hypothetical protein